jgi:hypothetical protein
VLIKLIGFGDKSMLNKILWSPNYDQIAASAARIIADERNKVLLRGVPCGESAGRGAVGQQD